MRQWRWVVGLIVACALPTGLAAQAGTIEGEVRQARTGEAVAGVQITLQGSERGTLSMPDGRFLLGSVAAGRYTVIASALGYATERRAVVVRAGQTLRLAVELSPEAVALGGITVVGERDGLGADEASATKMDIPLVETPQAVSVVTQEQLDILNVSSLGEAARYSAGIQAEPFGLEPRFAFLRIRGFDATTTGLYRDGLQLRNPSYAVSYNLEPYGAERVEIVRGPASVLYGEGNPGGLINYVTKRPTFTPIGEVELELGSNERRQAQFDLGGAVGESPVAYRLTGVVRESGTQVDFVGDDRLYLAPALTWRPGSATSLTILSHYQDDRTRSSQALPAQGLLTSNPNGQVPVNRFTGEPDVDRYESTSYSAGYQLQHHTGRGLTLRQNLRWYSGELDDVSVYANALADDGRTLDRAHFASFGELSAIAVDNQAQLELSTGPVRHTLLAGVDYQRMAADLLQRFGAAPPLDLFDPEYGAPVEQAPIFRDEAIEQGQVGLYLQNHLELADRWVLSLAGRYDWAGTTTDNHLADAASEQKDAEFSGRAGLLYRSPLGFSPYVSYSESFLPALGADAEGEAFEPELGRQYEAGVKYQPAGSQSLLTLALFEVARKNFVEYDPATFLPVQSGEVVSRGVEVETVSRLPLGIDLLGSLTWLDQEVTESANTAEIGKRLTQTPDVTGSLWAGYRFTGGALDGFGLGSGVRYIGASFGDVANTLEVPSETLVDAALHYDWNRFRLSLNAQNLLNERHVASAFVRGSPLATFGAERTLTARVRYRW